MKKLVGYLILTIIVIVLSVLFDMAYNRFVPSWDETCPTNTDVIGTKKSLSDMDYICSERGLSLLTYKD